MRNEPLTLLRTYALEIEAQMDAAALEANGIPAEVSADTAGGTFPSLALIFPVRLLVREADIELALEILDTPADPPTDYGESQA